MKDNKSNLYFISLGILITIGILFIITVLLLTENKTIANGNPDENFPQGYRIVSPEIPTYLE
ncbi:MAG: hypothetical protein KJZ60_12395, partial [Ignavibacteriaceae bacterium]|nr:hypothetical protein [Ignavibacteriaceae bacterium]